MEFLTEEKLAEIIPQVRNLSAWYKALQDILPKYKINTKERVVGFLSQCVYESRGFTELEENMNYSAQRLVEVFPNHFANGERNPNKYAHNPSRIANVVYANRLGNGTPDTGDGWSYRGRGIIQLTGKSNYEAFAQAVNRSLNDAVTYIQTPEGAIEAAAWYWDSRHINDYADMQDVVAMTHKVNGGTHGLSEREVLYTNISVILGLDSAKTDVSASIKPIKASVGSFKKGMKGPGVIDLQKLLGVTADGDFGPKTEAAVKKWQKEHNLVVDGIAGPKTMASLKKDNAA